MTARWWARKAARTTPDHVLPGGSTSRRCIALLASAREIILAQWERHNAPVHAEPVGITHIAIFERRPLERHRENRLLLPFHDLPLLLLLGDPSARVQDHSPEF